MEQTATLVGWMEGMGLPCRQIFCSYSCGRGGGMDSSGGGASGTGSTRSTSFFNGTASAEWGSSNSGNGGLNNGGALPLVEPTTGTQPSGAPGAGGGVLGSVFLSSNTSGCLGCGGRGGSGNGSRDLHPCNVLIQGRV